MAKKSRCTKAWERFADEHIDPETEQCLVDMMEKAFRAGWQAAHIHQAQNRPRQRNKPLSGDPGFTQYNRRP